MIGWGWSCHSVRKIIKYVYWVWFFFLVHLFPPDAGAPFACPAIETYLPVFYDQSEESEREERVDLPPQFSLWPLFVQVVCVCMCIYIYILTYMIHIKTINVDIKYLHLDQCRQYLKLYFSLYNVTRPFLSAGVEV